MSKSIQHWKKEKKKIGLLVFSVSGAKPSWGMRAESTIVELCITYTINYS
jgi:hypothetical protein